MTAPKILNQSVFNLNKRSHFSDVLLLGVEHFFCEQGNVAVVTVVVAQMLNHFVYSHSVALYHHLGGVGGRRVAVQVSLRRDFCHCFRNRANVLRLGAAAAEHSVCHMVDFSVAYKLLAQYAVNSGAVFNALAHVFDPVTAHLGVLKDVIQHFYIIYHYNHL